ncbi:MAG: ATP synthase F0 subunit B [Deltaproteobacteria bacterium]|nr:ATP synthase F0 subunit B [Deltaproteobacteria bacterium]
MVSISPDWSVLIQVVNFLLIIVILNHFLFRPIRGILQERKEKIEGFETDIEQISSHADERGQEIESRLVDIRREGFDQKEVVKGRGQDDEKRIIGQANDQAEEAMRKITEQIADEVGAAREALRADLEVFSRELAQKVLGRSLS